MRVGRNDPCPCGSGRKFKSCCGRGGGAKPEPPLPQGLSPEVRKRAEMAPVWEAELVAVSAKIAGKDRSRTVAALVVADDVVLGAKVHLATAAEPEDVAEALEEALSEAAIAVGRWPATVLVRHREVGDVLGPLLEGRGCGVRVTPFLDGLDPLARELTLHLSGQEGWPAASPPETWAGWGLPEPLVGELFQAYGAYHKASPWRWLDDVPPLIAEWKDGTGPWVASVMGAGLGEFGLAIHSRLEDFQDLLDRAEDTLPFQDLRGWVVHLGYYHRREIPRAMLKEISRAGWKVETVAAYPYILPVLTPGGGLQKDLVRRLTQLLRGVAALAESYGPRLRSPVGGVFTWTGEGLTLVYEVAPEMELLQDGPPPGLREVVEEIRELGLETEEEIEALVARSMGGYNATPQEVLGGISPDQAQTLMREGLKGGGPLRLAEGLCLEELEGSAFLGNARLFLHRLAETGGAGATTAGNLKRAFVAELLEVMRWREGYLEDLHRMNRVVNEDDAWPLHVLRVNLEIAGLVKLRKGTFSITKRGREMAAPQAAGRLNAHLFRCYFGDFNLEYGHGGHDGPSLQPAVPLLLWLIGVRARDWISVGELARLVLPGRPGDFAPDERPTWSGEAAGLEYKLLMPLSDFGVLERRKLGGEAERWRRTQEDTQVRTTPLFEGFLDFDWG